MKDFLKTYVLRNAGWLMVPPLLLNLFTSKLPPAYAMSNFWANIPSFIAIPENTLRYLVCFLPFLMPLSVETKGQKIGVLLYILGVLAYFLGWGAEILFPLSAWSTSWTGFLAPAYTALFWLLGIGLICKRFFFKSPYRSWMYLLAVLIFIAFHVTHTAIVFSRGI